MVELSGERERDEVRYPPYVVSEEERRRWELSQGIAVELFGDAGGAHVWQATRAIYYGDIPTE